MTSSQYAVSQKHLENKYLLAPAFQHGDQLKTVSPEPQFLRQLLILNNIIRFLESGVCYILKFFITI